MVFVACFSVLCMVVYGMCIMLHGSIGIWKKIRDEHGINLEDSSTNG